MTSYKNILLNFLIAGSIFAIVVTSAIVVREFYPEEVAVMISAGFWFIIFMVVRRKVLKDRSHPIWAVLALTFISGFAGLAAADYIEESYKPIFLLGYLLLPLVFIYLAISLFSTGKASD